MSKCRERMRSPHARYTLRWFDATWNEIPGSECPMVCASAMLESIENWNRACQRESRDTALVVPDVTLPAHLSIEVHYV